MVFVFSFSFVCFFSSFNSLYRSLVFYFKDLLLLVIVCVFFFLFTAFIVSQCSLNYWVFFYLSLSDVLLLTTLYLQFLLLSIVDELVWLVG